jgi:plastocyanin
LLDGRSDETAKESRSALVWFEPERPVRVEVPKESFEMVTVRKEFQPKVMPVPVGSTVSFPNQDPILHNVFSVSGENRFDLGLYRGGDAKDTRFDHAGVVRVFCNVHHSMVAYVAVLQTPYYGRLGRDGSFHLDDLPAGPGRLTIWHERAEPETINLILPLASPLRLDLNLTKEQIPRHRNKFGKPYTRTRRGKAY